MTIHRVLFPTDFSDCSRAAFAQAVHLAKLFDAELVVLHAVVLHREGIIDPLEHLPALRDLYDRAQRVARDEMGLLLDGHQPPTAPIREVVRRGIDVSEVILDTIASEDVDAVVMATHGRRGPGRLFLGSVTEEVIRSAPCPVLAVRRRDVPWEPLPFGRIMVPLDFSTAAEGALDLAVELARPSSAKLDLLHVSDGTAWDDLYSVEPRAETTQRRELLAKDCRARLRRLANAFASDVAWEIHHLVGSPAREIVEHAAASGADLIVMATLGRTGLERLILGSTTAAVLRLAGCPVMVVNAGIRDRGREPALSSVGERSDA